MQPPVSHGSPQPFSLISVACPDAQKPCCLLWFLNCPFSLSFDGYHYLHSSSKRGTMLSRVPTQNQHMSHQVHFWVCTRRNQTPDSRMLHTGVRARISIASKEKQPGAGPVSIWQNIAIRQQSLTPGVWRKLQCQQMRSSLSQGDRLQNSKIPSVKIPP